MGRALRPAQLPEVVDRAGQAHYAVMNSGMTSQPTSFAVDVDAIRRDRCRRAKTKYTSLLTQIHNQVFHLPLWGLRIIGLPPLAATRHAPGQQQFDYPIKDAYAPRLEERDDRARRADRLFSTVGRMDPHTYRHVLLEQPDLRGPVAYGTNGDRAGARGLVDEHDRLGRRRDVRFTLRTGVTFHDGGRRCAPSSSTSTTSSSRSLGRRLGLAARPSGRARKLVVRRRGSCSGNAPTTRCFRSSAHPPLRMLSPGAFVNGSTPTRPGTTRATSAERVAERHPLQRYAYPSVRARSSSSSARTTPRTTTAPRTAASCSARSPTTGTASRYRLPAHRRTTARTPSAPRSRRSSTACSAPA